MDDPLYGMQPDPKSRYEFGFNLGAMDARGERGALVVDQDFLTRLPSNPFFPYVLERVAEGIERPSGPTGRNLAVTPVAGPARAPRSPALHLPYGRRGIAAVRRSLTGSHTVAQAAVFPHRGGVAYRDSHGR